MKPQVHLIVTVDTEEDQWGFTRDEPTVDNIQGIPAFQEVLESCGAFPTYLINYPVADSDGAVEILSRIHGDGRCEIGAHLHPWNTPPVEEDVTAENSMMCNLPFDLQRRKLQTLVQRISSRFGRAPRVFRTGRWGLGSSTLRALIECGFTVDTSVSPFVSWTRHHGPDFSEMPFTPYAIDDPEKMGLPSASGKLLEVPVTVGYNRWPFRRWHGLHATLGKGAFRSLHVLGIAQRTNLLKKIWLSPEESSAADMLCLSRVLVEHGVNVLNMSLHSTTLMPGLSPFVKDQADLDRFFETLAAYLTGLRRFAEVSGVGLSGYREIVAREQA